MIQTASVMPGLLPSRRTGKDWQSMVDDQRQKTPSFGGRPFVTGFTLLEVLVSLLLMGLATGAIFEISKWGSQQYRSIVEETDQQAALQILRSTIRRHVTSGHPEQLQQEHLAHLLSPSSRLKIAEFGINRYAQEACMVRLRLYVDRNENGRVDPQELLPPWTLCFRPRAGV